MIVIDRVVIEKETDHPEIESIEIRSHRDHRVNHEDIDIAEDRDHGQYHPDHREVHIQGQDQGQCHIHGHVHHRERVVDHEEVQDHGNQGVDHVVIHGRDLDQDQPHIQGVDQGHPQDHHRYNQG